MPELIDMSSASWKKGKVAPTVPPPSMSDSADDLVRPKGSHLQSSRQGDLKSMKKVMDNPNEWDQFRKQLKAGGHVTSAAAAMAMMKRSRSDKAQGEDGAADQSRIGDTISPLAHEREGDEQDEEDNLDLVNKGLRWINQTLQTSANSMSQETSASTLDHSSRSNFSLDATIESQRRLADGENPPRRRGRRRPVGPDSGRNLGRAGSSASMMPRSASSDAVSHLMNNVNISAKAHDDPMTQEKVESRRKSAEQDAAALAAYTRSQDEDFVEGAHVSGHLDVHSDDEEGNIVEKAAKIVRRRSGSFVEYFSGLTGEGVGAQDMEDMKAAEEEKARKSREQRVTRRGGRRRANSLDLMTAMINKGLEHEIDAADFEANNQN